MTIHIYFHYYYMKYSSTALWNICNKFTKRPFLKTLAIQRHDSTTHPLFKSTFVVPHSVATQQSRVTLMHLVTWSTYGCWRGARSSASGSSWDTEGV